MLTDEQMRQAAVLNPGRCIYRSWNPNRQYPKWEPMNFHPDNWRKLDPDTKKREFIKVKSGFDKIEKADPPSGETKVNLVRPDSWNYDRYGYPITDFGPRRPRY